MKIIKAFLNYREGKNPLDKILVEKRKMLTTYQTPRTAKEFYETIRQTFAEVKIPVKKGIIFDREYPLEFREQEDLILLYLKPNGSETAVSIQESLEIAVTVEPAIFIPGLEKDIFLGRNGLYEKMPSGVRINDKTYNLNYGFSKRSSLRGKSS
jgi:hypothetical protein